MNHHVPFRMDSESVLYRTDAWAPEDRDELVLLAGVEGGAELEADERAVRTSGQQGWKGLGREPPELTAAAIMPYSNEWFILMRGDLRCLGEKMWHEIEALKS